MADSSALKGPYEGCDCGIFSLMWNPDRKPSICERCGTRMFKGCVWKAEDVFCVHCGHPFEIDHLTLVNNFDTLGVKKMTMKCAKCEKITKVVPNITFDLEADPPIEPVLGSKHG